MNILLCFSGGVLGLFWCQFYIKLRIGKYELIGMICFLEQGFPDAEVTDLDFFYCTVDLGDFRIIRIFGGYAKVCSGEISGKEA
ncbi:hypothetical protein [Chryseobacterium sp. SORGH_AS_1175]|uniref:hypothetical protein n=1 Tax=Chryseobacterium sp. SORGH_AS_1175 TaxID=3041760 RepID=UPI0028543A45|nr:hypothetical protein [Chryseobacterium sp. SORGH_AS_1175]MDR6132488.1 hypothetical protein [Chryseobacterium sp. SORGH_AS_1175]